MGLVLGGDLQFVGFLLGGCLTVKNWWCHLLQHLGINATNYFMYDSWGLRASHHPHS